MTVAEVGFTYSEHYKFDNVRREMAIRSIGGDGTNIVMKVYWNKGHSEGGEWHWVTDNGIIIITNAVKDGGRRVCTKLIARPNQILRYTQMGFKNELTEQTKKMRRYIVPKWLLNRAHQHQQKGLNYV